MKKYLAVTLFFTMLICSITSLSGCGNQNNSEVSASGAISEISDNFETSVVEESSAAASISNEEESITQSSVQSQEEESQSESSVESTENSEADSSVEASNVDDILTASNNPKRASREDAIAYGRIINDTTAYIMWYDKKYVSTLYADDYVYVIHISENNYVGILLDGFIYPVNYSDVEIFPSDYEPDFDHHIWLF